MEKENNQIMLEQKLEFFDMLEEALMIPYKNMGFTFLAFCVSLPLLCFMVFFETTLQITLVEASNILKPSYGYSFYGDYVYWPQPYYSIGSFTSLSPKLIQLCFLFLVPYYLLDLFNMVVIVHMASKIYTGEAPVSLRGLMHKPNKISLKGSFITSIYVHLLSTSTLFGMIWIVTNYSILSMSFYKQALLTVLHGAAFVALLIKYLDWSAGWNMGIVISILEEEVCGIEALELSGYYSRGSTRRGQLLMLVFFVWGLGLRLPCFYAAMRGRVSGIAVTFVLISLVCLGNVMKWVACMVYFYDCKSRILEKKFDDKFAREAKVTDV